MLDALFLTFLFTIGVQLFFAVLFLPFTLAKPTISNSACPLPISVIIAARNEAENLLKFLPLVLEQSHPNFEVLVINDASSDNTRHVLHELGKTYPCLKAIHHYPAQTYSGNKKKALGLGIASAKNDYLIFTDADCRPTSEDWLSIMASSFSEDKKIVLGYGKHQKIPGSLLNKLIRFETLLTAIQYFSYAKAGTPYMGVGRNLGYAKNLYEEKGKFDHHEHIRSGDDDLFINTVANGKNTALCFTPKSFTVSEPKKSFKDWLNQKRRHISTAAYYKPVHQFFLGIFYLSQSLFYLLAIILLITAFKPYWVLLLVFIRFMAMGIVYTAIAKKLEETDLIVLFFILEPVLILGQFLFFVNNLIRKPNFW